MPTVSSKALVAALALTLHGVGLAVPARPQDPAGDPPAASAAAPQSDPAPENPSLDREVEVAGPEAPKRPAFHGHLPLGFAGSGLCLGNSRSWNGLRVNFRDHGVERVRGVNLTLWSPRDPALKRMEGIGLGVAPAAEESRGVALGLLATVTGERAEGVHVGGLAAVGGGGFDGVQVGGLSVVSGGRTRGVSVGGLAVVAAGGADGASVGGLAVVSQGGSRGVSVGGLAVVSEGPQRGIGLAGLALVSGSEFRGIGAAGLATIAADRFDGIGVSGLATICAGHFTGIGIGGLAVGSGDMRFRDLAPSAPPYPDRETSATGLMLAGYRVQANELRGVAGALLVTRAHDMTGLSFAAYNGVSGRQTGASVGLFNYASELRGVQIGLLNHVGDNPPWARWLPLVNAHF